MLGMSAGMLFRFCIKQYCDMKLISACNQLDCKTIYLSGRKAKVHGSVTDNKFYTTRNSLYSLVHKSRVINITIA